VDCGIYTLKKKFGLSAQSKSSNFEYRSIHTAGAQQFEEFAAYVEEYGRFLAEAYSIYDYAFDFDCDPILGGELSDILSNRLFDLLGNKVDKIARVYHTVRGEVSDWWSKLCIDDRFSVVAIEGGQDHRSTPQFYDRLIDKAHAGGKKVHVLAISGAVFPRRVDADYMDTSTHRSGGHKGQIITPYGTYTCGKKIDNSHITIQPRYVKNAVRQFVEVQGFELEQLIDPYPDAQYFRMQQILRFMDVYWDVPYVASKEKSMDIFDDIRL